jgi:hypothetical protein
LQQKKKQTTIISKTNSISLIGGKGKGCTAKGKSSGFRDLYFGSKKCGLNAMGVKAALIRRHNNALFSFELSKRRTFFY